MAIKTKWSEKRIKMLQEDGRGKGTGSNYIPWVQVTDFSSLGHSRRVFSRKTGRIHHLLSDVEWYVFLLLEFSPNVVDIREQFPLPREDTLSIAAQQQIKHSNYPGTKVPLVMTCDFFVTTLVSEDKSLKAISCKRNPEVSGRDLEKLEIERRYFNQVGIPHHLLFYGMLPINKINNLIWCRNATINDQDEQASSTPTNEMAERFVRGLQSISKSLSLTQYCEHYDNQVGAAPGTGLRIARSLLWNDELITDMHQKDLAATPIAMFHTKDQPSHLKVAVG